MKKKNYSFLSHLQQRVHRSGLIGGNGESSDVICEIVICNSGCIATRVWMILSMCCLLLGRNLCLSCCVACTRRGVGISYAWWCSSGSSRHIAHVYVGWSLLLLIWHHSKVGDSTMGKIIGKKRKDVMCEGIARNSHTFKPIHPFFHVVVDLYYLELSHIPPAN